MPGPQDSAQLSWLQRARLRLIGTDWPNPLLLAMPVLCLVAFWLWGEAGLVACAAVMPVGYLMYMLVSARMPARAVPQQTNGTRADFLALLVPGWRAGGKLGGPHSNTACFVVEIDDFARLQERFGHVQADLIADRIGSRIRGELRPQDCMLRVGDARFCFVLQPSANADLEACIAICGRIQTAIEKAVRTDRLTLHTTAAIGFCLRDRAPGGTVEEWLEAAEVALSEAQTQGVGGLRGYTRDLARKSELQIRLRDAAEAALMGGEIAAWFQPQVSTDTGDISGFEALARWHHPDLGVLGPGQFLPALEEANLLGKLGEVILKHSVAALVQWDAAGLHVPTVGVNFSEDDLRDPTLVDRISWVLEQAGIQADRLTIEVLESVINDGQDATVSQTLSRLADLGCRVDMDDFGTGNASISAIRRLQISRIKIDRSLVKGVDRDPEQQRMIAAVLTMTEKLAIDCLGEGVETPGEHAMLAQLGCRHVQGYGIALPMPLEDTVTWISTHRSMMPPAPTLSQPGG